MPFEGFKNRPETQNSKITQKVNFKMRAADCQILIYADRSI